MSQIKLLIAFVILILLSKNVVGQERVKEWQLGYFAPYLSNIGGALGFSFDLKNIESGAENKSHHHRLQLLTQVSGFSHINVSNNMLLNSELVYKLNKIDKRFFLTTSVGAGYLLMFQRQDGVLNLSTGTLDYRNEALNFFLPNINLAVGFHPGKYLGYFVKTTYGVKLSTEYASTSFFCISTGVLFNMK